jgi:hypothetical protein
MTTFFSKINNLFSGNDFSSTTKYTEDSAEGDEGIDDFSMDDGQDNSESDEESDNFQIKEDSNTVE